MRTTFFAVSRSSAFGACGRRGARAGSPPADPPGVGLRTGSARGEDHPFFARRRERICLMRARGSQQTGSSRLSGRPQKCVTRARTHANTPRSQPRTCAPSGIDLANGACCGSGFCECAARVARTRGLQQRSRGTGAHENQASGPKYLWPASPHT